MCTVIRAIAICPIIFVILSCDSSVLRGQSSFAIGYSIPDPNKKLSIADFLTNDSVADELKLDDEQRNAIKTLVSENGGGSLSTVRLRLDKDGPRLGADEINLQFEAIRARNLAILEETIDPIQLDRLKQLVYQIERSRVGLGNSLAAGFLGKDIGIESDQKAAIRTVAASAEKKAEKAILELKDSVIDELIRELTSSQQEVAKQALGAPFTFRENTSTFFKEYRTKTRSGKTASIPNPTSLVAIAALALNGSVAKELKLTSEQRVSIEDMHKNAKGPLPLAEFKVRGSKERDQVRNEVQLKVDEVFAMEQKDRLSQLAYRVEIERVGVLGAIVDGYLGELLGIDDSQKRKLERKFEALKPKASKEMRRINQSARDEVFMHLTPIQRENALKLVGNDFVFQEKYQD